MALNDSTNEATVRRLYSVLSGLAAKIKNTFVKSVKITSSGSELKDSDGNAVIPLASTSAAGAMSSADKLMLDQTALLVSSTGINSNKAYKLCRFRLGSSYGVGIEGIIRGSYVASFKLNSYVYQSSSGSNPWSSSKLSLTYQTVNGVPNAKFYYKVGSATVGDIVDIYVFFPSTYSRYEVGPIAGCKAVPESDDTKNGVYFYNQDVTADWSTLVTELTEITDNDASGTSASDLPTELKVIAKAKESSGTAPVKVDASGNLSAVDVKSTYIPTGTGSDAPVNGMALANALAGGVDTAKQVVNNDNNVKYKLDSGGLDVYDEQSGQRNSGTKVGISGVEINSGTTESTTLNSSGLDLLKNGQHVKVSHSGFVGPLTGNVTGNVSGSAGSLDVNGAVGGPTVPVYIKADGTPEACTLALNSDVLPITSEKELSSDELTTYANFLIVNNAKVKIYFERLQPGVAYKFYNPQGSYCDLCFARESNMTCYRTWNSSTEQLQTSVFVSPPSLQRTMGMAVVVRVGTKAYVAGY